jgi:hypothetical protein
LEYDRDVVGALVRDLRGRAERGEVSMWKWRLVRRAAAILEALSETGLVDVPALTPWGALRPAPTADEQADRDNLHALVWNTQQALKASGLSAKTLANYQYDGFDRVVRAHRDLGLTRYSETVADQVVGDARDSYERGAMGTAAWRAVRRCVAKLGEYRQTGRVTRDQLPRWGLREPGPGFANVLGEFCAASLEAGTLAASTIGVARSSVRRFLFTLEDAGVATLDGLTRRAVSDAVTSRCRELRGGLGSSLFGIRAFLRHLHERAPPRTTSASACPRSPRPDGSCARDSRSRRPEPCWTPPRARRR